MIYYTKCQSSRESTYLVFLWIFVSYCFSPSISRGKNREICENILTINTCTCMYIIVTLSQYNDAKAKIKLHLYNYVFVKVFGTTIIVVRQDRLFVRSPKLAPLSLPRQLLSRLVDVRRDLHGLPVDVS